MDAAFWNNRYAVAHYVYGEPANAFVAAMAPQIPRGPVLGCIRYTRRAANPAITSGCRVVPG